MFSLRGNIGEVALVKDEAVGANLTQGTARISPSETCDAKYLLWAIRSPNVAKEILRRAKGTTFQEISLLELRKIPIPMPSIREQKKIADIMSSSEQLLHLGSEIINELGRFKRGLMQHLLTRGIGHTRFKQTKIGEIPESWEVVPLSDLADYINGYAFKPSDWSNRGLPIIRIRHLTNPDAEFDFFEGKLEGKYLIQNGDLLFSWSATLGSFIWNRGSAYLNQHIFKVLPNKGICKDWLHYIIDHSISGLMNHSHGSTMKHIRKGVLKKYLVAVPPEEEQNEIANILIDMDSMISNEKQFSRSLTNLKKGLMQVLLTGKVRVKT